YFFFSSRRRHTRFSRDWSSDVCSSDLVVGLRPEVDHLVVLLALGNQAGGVLGLDFLHFLGGRIDDARLLVRDDEVVHADRHTREIGRASCRERGWILAGAVTLKRNEKS